jgi:ADP-ribosylglycohydrolase
MFVRWLRAEAWTPHGEVFDVGNTTADAIRRLDQGVPPLHAGSDDELSNVNGSLMRSLPVALWFASQPSEIIVEAAHRFSALTHRHPRSQVGCAVFCLIAKLLLAGCDTETAIEEGYTEAHRYYRSHPFLAELQTYSLIRPAAILRRMKRDRIRASGYVVDRLQACLWCLLNAHSFEAAVLAAVNLGDDADTTGAITGALAGIRFGVEAIPLEWRRKLVRHHELDALFNALVTGIKSK